MADMCMDVAPMGVACLVPPPPAGEVYRTPWCHLDKGHFGPCRCGDLYWRGERYFADPAVLVWASEEERNNYTKLATDWEAGTNGFFEGAKGVCRGAVAEFIANTEGKTLSRSRVGKHNSFR